MLVLTLLCAGAALRPAVLEAQMSVQPENSALSAPVGSSGSTTFTLRTDDPNMAQNTIQISCDGAVVSCSTDPWVMISSSGPATITVNYTVGNTTGATGTITISMTDQFTLETAEGTADVTVQSATPRVTADSATQYTGEGVSTNYPWFHVQNFGDTPATYMMTCSGSVGSCSVRAQPPTLAPGASANVIVDYQSGYAAGGNETLTLKATSQFSEISDHTVAIVPLSEDVRVLPDGASDTVAVNAYVQVPFTVHETGNASSGFRYKLTATCSGSVVVCTWVSTGADTTSLPPGPGADQTVSLWLHGTSVLSGGSGTATVTGSSTDGWGHTYQDQGSYSVVTPDARVGLPLSIVTPTGLRDPALCVASCFDATYAYVTPAYTSLDVPRSVGLGYRSGLAHPVVTVAIDAVDTTTSGARQISTKMWHGSTPVTFTNGTTESFFAGASGNNRLTVQYDASQLAPGISRDSVVVTAYLNDGTSRSGSIIVPSIVLNGASSPLGAGWTVLGLARGYVQANGNVLVTDGTGAASVFSKPAGCSYGCTYGAPSGDFRALVGPSSTDGTYALRAVDGTVATLDGAGYALSVADRFGNTTRYSYVQGALHTITDPAGQVTTLTYGTQPSSGATVLQSITTPGGRTTQVTVDASGNLTQIVRPDGSIGFVGSYDAAHRLTRWYNRATMSGGSPVVSVGDQWDVTYDSAQKVSSVTEPQLVADGVTVRPVVTYTSIEASTVALPGAANGTSTTPVAHVDTTALRARITDARGNVTSYVLDHAGAPVRVDEPLGRTTTIQRDQAERVLQATTPAGDQATYTYSGPDLITTVDGYTGRTVHMVYEPTYHQVTRVYGDADSVWNYWSAAGRLDSTRTGTSKRAVVAYTYDSRGRVVRRAQGAYTDSAHYSPTGWQNTDTTIVAGRTSSQHFNSWGLVDQVTDAAGYVSQMIYDGLGRVQMAIGPRSDTTTYYYDASFLTGVKDANGQLYQYIRNGLGWTTQQVDPRNASAYIGYDRNGNITSTTNRRGQTVTASYDSLDDMTSQVAGGATTTYATDPLGRFVADSNAESIDTARYDPAGRMTSEITVRKGTRYERVSTYDIRGQRTGVAFTSEPWGKAVSAGYRYDAMERLDSLIDMAGGVTVIAYDSLDRPISTTLPNGMNIGTPFANLLRPTDLTYSNQSVNATLGASYAYGPRGELTDRIAPSGTAGREFDTDAEGQLTGFANYTMTSGVCKYQQMPPDPPERVCTGSGKSYAGASASYSWDKVGNPTYNGATMDTGNRLRQFGSDSLAYDADGNLVGRYQNHALVESFVWDALGQLTSVTQGTTTLSFGYDGFGRRVRKRASVNGVLHTTNYFHDGDNLWVTAIADGSQLESVTTSYPGVDQPHSIYQNGAISYYLQDVSGNITGLVDTAGTLQNHYSYLPFGAADTTVEAVTNTLKFAAREYDAEIGLYYMRARYYDPRLGRFISEDPLGVAAGLNTFAYANNDPTDSHDPWGLCTQDMSDFDKTLMEDSGVAWCIGSSTTTATQAWFGGFVTGGPSSPFGLPNPSDGGGSLTGDQASRVLTDVGRRLQPAQPVLEAIGTAELGLLMGAAASGRATVTVIGNYPKYLSVARATGMHAFDVGETLYTIAPTLSDALNVAYIRGRMLLGEDFYVAFSGLATTWSTGRIGEKLNMEVQLLESGGYERLGNWFIHP